MAWATSIKTPRQVKYRLAGRCGCPATAASNKPHLPEDEEREESPQEQQHAARYGPVTERPMEWVGTGLVHVGLVAGDTVVKEAALALLGGRHPQTGEQLRRRQTRIHPDGQLPTAPFARALREAAATAGVTPSELIDSATQRARWARIEGALTRHEKRQAGLRRHLEQNPSGQNDDQPPQQDTDEHNGKTEPTAPYRDLRRLARAAGLDLADIYPPQDLAFAAANQDRRIATGTLGLDVTLNFPKSVSVLYALAGPEIALAIEEELAATVHDTHAALDHWAGYALTGHQGNGRIARRTPGSGLMGWMMIHHTARPRHGLSLHAGDPHLHAHLIVPNLIRRNDGQWRAPASGGRDIYRHIPAIGEFAKARLRTRLTARLGVAWYPDPANNEWEIVGIPTDLRQAFSGRRKQIMAVAGRTTPARRRVAAAKLAEAKRPTSLTALRETWRLRAEELIDVDQLLADVLPVPIRGRTPLPPPEPQDIAARIRLPQRRRPARDGGWEHRQILTAVMATLPHLTDITQAEALTNAVLALPGHTRLPRLHASHHTDTTRHHIPTAATGTALQPQATTGTPQAPLTGTTVSPVRTTRQTADAIHARQQAKTPEHLQHPDPQTSPNQPFREPADNTPKPTLAPEDIERLRRITADSTNRSHQGTHPASHPPARPGDQQAHQHGNNPNPASDQSPHPIPLSLKDPSR